MNESILLSEELYSRYGEVKRSRGCFLYTAKQVRLVDMYQEAGRAILGWGGGKAKLEFKNAFDRGVTGSFLTHYSYQVKKAANQLLPDYPNVRWYYSKESLYKALSCYLGVQYPPKVNESPVLANLSDVDVFKWISEKNITLWRPWLEDAWFSTAADAPTHVHESLDVINDVMVVCPPFPWAVTAYLVVYTNKNTDRITPSDVCPPPFLAGLARSLYDLYAELTLRTENDWSKYDKVLLKYFERRGPYLLSKIPKEKYRDFFIHCLDCHIIVSPSFDQPSIIPYGADEGVFRILQKNPYNWE